MKIPSAVLVSVLVAVAVSFVHSGFATIYGPVGFRAARIVPFCLVTSILVQIDMFWRSSQAHVIAMCVASVICACVDVTLVQTGVRAPFVQFAQWCQWVPFPLGMSSPASGFAAGLALAGNARTQETPVGASATVLFIARAIVGTTIASIVGGGRSAVDLLWTGAIVALVYSIAGLLAREVRCDPPIHSGDSVGIDEVVLADEYVGAASDTDLHKDFERAALGEAGVQAFEEFPTI